MSDTSSLLGVTTKDLASKLYGACLSGDLPSAYRYIAVLSTRQEGDTEVKKVFATNCTMSGREGNPLPKVSQ
jgi:hypothetical protein